MEKIKIALHGLSGRMGQALSAEIAQDRECELSSFEEADLIMDFSHESALSDLLCRALNKGVPLLIGTTGFPSLEPLKKAAERIPLLYSPNFSLGILALKCAAEQIGRIMGRELSPYIIEEHHVQKKDKPSGTALMLKKSFPESEIFSLRTPGTIGNHTLIFSTEDEEITLTHRAKSRLLFARGALIAAKKLLVQPKGYYELQDLI